MQYLVLHIKTGGDIWQNISWQLGHILNTGLCVQMLQVYSISK